METCVVLITAPDEQIAASLAEVLVEERLAACVNILPGITSIYRWEGAVQRDREVLLVVKTRQALVESGSLIARLKVLHPYDVPEVIALPIIAGLQDYLKWVLENTAPEEGKAGDAAPHS